MIDPKNFDVISPMFKADNPDYNPMTDYCGSGRLGCLVPDRPLGIDLTRACYLHDFRWQQARTWQKAREANLKFYADIYALAKSNGLSHVEAAAMAEVYFRGVNSWVACLIFWKGRIFG